MEKMKTKTEVPVYAIYVCMFCNKPGNRLGGLINIPETYNGMPLSFNGCPASKLRKLKVKCHKSCLDRVLSTTYQSRMRIRESLAIT